MSCSWKLLISPPADGSWNMAVDEYILGRFESRDKPVLRFYSWHPPTISLGYAQTLQRHIDVEACRQRGIRIVRRPTGGKAVLHDRELTYSIIGRLGQLPFESDLLSSYREIARAFQEGFKEMGLNAEMAPKQKKAAGAGISSCFAQPSAYEITIHDRKILGSAQKRTRSGVLQHGSLLFEYHDSDWNVLMLRNRGENVDRITSLKRELGFTPELDWVQNSLRIGFQKTFNIEFEPLILTPAMEDEINAIARSAYPNLVL